MALGRQRDRLAEMLVTWSELPRSPGHVFYDRLQQVLISAAFDGFVEDLCASHYAAVRGRPSLRAGVHLPVRPHHVGCGASRYHRHRHDRQLSVAVITLQADPSD
jgi:transposase